MSRRSMLVKAVRQNAAKQKAPQIIIFPAWASLDGEPLVTWALSSRTPTKEELTVAVAAWKRSHATEQATHVDNRHDTLKPAQGSGQEEIDQ